MNEQNDNSHWIMGGLLLACVGTGVYLFFFKKNKTDKSGNPVVNVTGEPPNGSDGEGTRDQFNDYCEYILNTWEAQYINNYTEESLYAICKEWYPNEDIRNMNINRAMDIIYSDYWIRYNIHKLPEHLRMMVLDCAINQGQPTSIRLLQSCAGVAVDGVNGNKTQAAAKTVTIDAYYTARKAQYEKSAQGAGRAQYLAGWMNRLNDVTQEAKK
jgi:hypothetical protein